jgi:hypothetical protein
VVKGHCASLLEGFDFRIVDNFAIAGSDSTSLMNSWNLVPLASFMQFLSDLFRALRSFKDDLAGMLFYTGIGTLSWRPQSLRSTSHSALSP